MGKLSSSKAKEILHDKSVHGHPLTDKQRRFFGAIAGGAKPYKAESGGWLDSYEQGGLILKKKTKDNYGTKPNVNDVEAKTGPGFVGAGWNTKGRNYSPAWGGQFQMGGSMPGTVGFMYARTINPAPSNGKYTKKTQASAQNGQEMKYYQEGLDFKPKTISQDGTYVKKPRTDMLTMDEYRVQKANQSTISKAEPNRSTTSKALAIAANPMTALSYKLKGQNIPENFERGERNNLDYAMDIINPFGVAEAITSIPKNISKGEFLQAGLNALSVIPTGMELARNPIVKKASSIARDIPRAENVKEAIGRITGIPLKKDLPRLPAQDVKSLRQVQELGRMRDLGKSKSEQIKYALDNNLSEQHFSKYFGKSKEEAQNLLNTQFAEQEAASRDVIRARVAALEGDPFAPDPDILLPIDLNDIDADIDISQEEINEILTSPQREAMRARFRELDAQEAERDSAVREMLDRIRTRTSRNPQEYFSTTNDLLHIPRNFGNTLKNKVISFDKKLNTVINEKLNNFINTSIQNYPYYANEVQQKVPGLFLEGKEKGLKDVSKTVEFAPKGIKSGQVFTGSTNTSHSSYLPQLKQVFKYTSGQPQFLGYRPMNSLGYLSQTGYNTKDIAAYLNSEIDEQVKRGIIPKNIQRPFQKEETIMLPHYGVKQYKKGGIIKDDMGYWNPENWGESVEIGSNNITMQGVYEPLLGVSDEGDIQYMEPGKDYKFKGKKVTEHPIIQQDGWLDKYK